MDGVFSAAFIMAANSWAQNPLLSAASALSTPRWKSTRWRSSCWGGPHRQVAPEAAALARDRDILARRRTTEVCDLLAVSTATTGWWPHS